MIDYVSTNTTLLFILLIILIVILTYLFDRFVNPYSKNHSKYSAIIDKYTKYMSPMIHPRSSNKN